jgi:hypothetical protein
VGFGHAWMVWGLRLGEAEGPRGRRHWRCVGRCVRVVFRQRLRWRGRRRLDCHRHNRHGRGALRGLRLVMMVGLWRVGMRLMRVLRMLEGLQHWLGGRRGG